MSMQNYNVVTMDGLVRDLLNLDPEVLATMGGKLLCERRARKEGAMCQAGLNAFCRKVLTLHLAFMEDEAAVVRLKTDRTARANGWPDARTANVGMMLVWALQWHERFYATGKHVLLLGASDADAVLDPAPAIVGPGGLRSAGELVAEVMDPSKMSARESMLAHRARWSADPVKYVGLPIASTNDLIRSILGLDPTLLVGGPTEYPEIEGHIGLHSLCYDALRQYDVIKERQVTQVRLMSELDAKEGDRFDARCANFATLLSCGLTCEDRWEVTFQPPRAASREREDMLKAVARYVYLEGSQQAYDAFERLFEENVHFGLYHGYHKAELLVRQVGNEVSSPGEGLAQLSFSTSY